jgi:hypothetical protein
MTAKKEQSWRFELCDEDALPDPFNDLAINRPDVPLADYTDVLTAQLKHWTLILAAKQAAGREDMMSVTARSFVDALSLTRISEERRDELTSHQKEGWRQTGLGRAALSMLIREVTESPRRPIKMTSAKDAGYAQFTIDVMTNRATDLPQPVAIHIAPDELPEGLFPPTDKVEDWYRLMDDDGKPSLYVNYFNTAQPSPEAKQHLEAQGVMAESLVSQVTFLPYLPTRPA